MPNLYADRESLASIQAKMNLLAEASALAYGAAAGGGDAKNALSAKSQVIELQPGVYAAGKIQAVAGGGFVGKTFNTVIIQNDLTADYVVGRNASDQLQEYEIDAICIDGNKALGTFTGEGHGLDLRGFKVVRIGMLYVRNCAGHGVRFRNCETLILGTIVSENCDKFGFVIESSLGSKVTDVYFDKIISINCGQSGIGYTGIDFGDCLDIDSGPQLIKGGSLYAKNSGKVGVAFGRNVTGGSTGPRHIMIDAIFSEGSGQTDAGEGNGVEVFGAKTVQIGQIYVKDNAAHGVWLNKGDDGVTQSEDVNIGPLTAIGSGKHGVYCNGVNRASVGGIIANGNSKSSPGTYAGVSLYGDNNAALNGHISMASISALGDENQTKGLELQSGAQLGHIYVGNLDAHGHSAGDFVNAASTVEIEFGRKNTDIETPAYSAGLAKRLVKVADEYVARGQTSNATSSQLWELSLADNSLYQLTARVTGYSPDGAACAYTLRRLIKRTAGGNAATVGALGVIDSYEGNAATDATITASGSDAKAYLLVTGLAATTVNWEARLRVEKVG